MHSSMIFQNHKKRCSYCSLQPRPFVVTSHSCQLSQLIVRNNFTDDQKVTRERVPITYVQYISLIRFDGSIISTANDINFHLESSVRDASARVCTDTLGKYFFLMMIPISFGLTVGLFISSFGQGDSYQNRHFCITQRSRPLIAVALDSTVLSAADDLTTAVVASGKDVIKLKFEPIFRSFARNDYFVSDTYD